MATIRECDMCGCAIKPFGKVDFHLRKCRWEARFFDVPGKEWDFDLCEKCAQKIMSMIKKGRGSDATD